MKAEARSQKKVSQNRSINNFGHAEQSDISPEVNKMEQGEMASVSDESKVPDISDSSEETDIDFESIENSHEAVIRYNLDRFKCISRIALSDRYYSILWFCRPRRRRNFEAYTNEIQLKNHNWP